jgi:hypothetical protein
MTNIYDFFWLIAFVDSDLWFVEYKFKNFNLFLFLMNRMRELLMRELETDLSVERVPS